MNTYEINVSLDGHHLFATHERSIRDRETAGTTLELMRLKFPAIEGYEVTCTHYKTYGEKFEPVKA